MPVVPELGSEARSRRSQRGIGESQDSVEESAGSGSRVQELLHSLRAEFGGKSRVLYRRGEREGFQFRLDGIFPGVWDGARAGVGPERGQDGGVLE